MTKELHALIIEKHFYTFALRGQTLLVTDTDMRLRGPWSNHEYGVGTPDLAEACPWESPQAGDAKGPLQGTQFLILDRLIHTSADELIYVFGHMSLSTFCHHS